MAVTALVFTNVAGTPATPQFCEVIIRGYSVESDGGNKPFVNILHFVRTDGPGTGTEDDFQTTLNGFIVAPLSAALSVAYVPTTNTCRYMDSPLNIGTNNTNTITGAVTGDRLPNFNAVVVRKNTNARGRSYRGSNHWGPIAESHTLLDNLTAAAIILWQAVADELEGLGTIGMVTPDGSRWKLCVISTTLSDLVSNPVSLTGSVVKTTPLNIRIGTMKRRKDRTGPST